ncbi:MAG: RagB/SusD family nutrient uptake outer membrane protein [Chitinophagaceae bacterium]
MKIYSKIILAIAFIVVASGCKKTRLNEDVSGVLTADLLFQTKAGFENALNGLYAEVRRYRSGNTIGDPINNIMNIQAVIGVDNAYGNWRDPQTDVFNLWGTLNLPGFSQYTRVFAWLYETINAANTIVDRSAKGGIDWTDADKNRIVAEARCIRAWCYRHLVYLWGDVPLTLTESRGDNIKTDWQRTPKAEVRKAMEDDWIFAAQYLPDVATSDARLIKGIPQHFLAELYLATGDYAKAKVEATKVTTNPAYKIVTARYGVNKAFPGTPFTDMFLDGNSKRSQGNTEALWVIQNELLVVGGEGNTIMRRYWQNRYYSLAVGGKNPISVSAENGGRGIGRLSPTRFALNLYAANDDRGSSFAFRLFYLINNANGIPSGTNPRTNAPYKLGDTIFLNTTSNETLSQANWPSVRKWDYAQPAPLDIVDREYNDQVFLRLAETYLVLAEANFRLGDLQGAADAINVLRIRAKATPATAAQITIDYILDERSRELFSEEDRRYALLRTGKWLERTRLYNKTASTKIVDRDTLFPIPQDVIDANRTKPMTQNPGY